MNKLSESTRRILGRAGITTLKDLGKMSNVEIASVRDMGRKSYNEIMELLGRERIEEPVQVNDIRKDLEKIFLPKFMEVQ